MSLCDGRGKIAVIAGAGPAGLTAALELLRRSDIAPIVFDADGQVGGISKTVNHRGNRMDLGGHRFFSKSDWVMRWWQDILPVAEARALPARPSASATSRSRASSHPRRAPRPIPMPSCSSVSGCRAFSTAGGFSIIR